MMLRRLFQATNGRARLVVGLLLAGLFLLNFNLPQAVRAPLSVALAIDGRQVGHDSPEALARIERLAREDQVALLELCLAEYGRRFRDYTCTFVKQERLAGKLAPQQTIAVSFTGSPFRVGMRWTKNPPRGDRVLYVSGRYGGKMLVRPTSGLLRALAPTVSRDPAGEDALRSTRRPVTQFGFRRGLERLLKVYRLARRRGESQEAFGGFAEVAGRKTVVLVRRLPDAQTYRHLAAPLTRVYVDLEWLVPVMVEGMEADGSRLICRYLYKDVKFNVGLGADDFRPEAFDLQEP
jgi:hypothetical protein